MADKSERHGRLRFRFSLLTAILVLTIVALAIVVVLQWREIFPLETKVRQLRTEVGSLTIDDSSLSQAIQLRQQDPNIWRWRIYLPPGGQYKLKEAGGLLPPRAGKPDELWLQDVDKAKRGVSRGEFSGVPLEGEFTLEASLLRRENGWRFAATPGPGVTIYHFEEDWPAELGRIVSSGVPSDAQRTLKPGERVLLLYLSMPQLTPAIGGGTRSEPPSSPAEGIVLWLEQQPPGPSGTQHP